jgi:plastocyanin
MITVLALSACTGNQGTNPPPAPPSPPPAGAACPATITIGPGNAYNPANCELKVGQSVTISAATGHPLTGNGAGQSVSGATTNQAFTFTQAGTFNFECDFHSGQGMKGAITIKP